MSYKWKQTAGGRTGTVNADTAGVILESIEQEQGGITPIAIVDAAREESNPLHGWFEWDDVIAGEKYRVSQAQDLVQALVVVYEDANTQQETECRAFVTIIEDDQRHYGSIGRVMLRDDLKEQIVADVKNTIQQCRYKLESYKGFEKAVKSLRTVEHELVSVGA